MKKIDFATTNENDETFVIVERKVLEKMRSLIFKLTKENENLFQVGYRKHFEITEKQKRR